MESSKLAVRTYRPGDEHAIQALYETVFERKRSLDEWRWRFQEPPAGSGLLHLLEHEERIVGHISHSSLPTWVDGKRLLLGQGGDTMVLPECRGRGGMRRLVETALAEGKYDLRLSFPSEMARPLFVRYGAGVVVGILPLWVRRFRLRRPVPSPVRPLARAVLAVGSFVADRPRPSMRIEPLSELTGEVDALAQASASFARIVRIRDAAYLRWRVLDQPDAKWSIRASRDPKGRLLGYSVLGLEDSPSGPVGWINDLLAPNYRTLRALLVDAVGTLAGRGAGSMYAYYLDPRPWARRAMIRTGFVPSKGHYFLASSLTPPAGGAAEQLESWYLTRTDTEPWPNLTDSQQPMVG